MPLHKHSASTERLTVLQENPGVMVLVLRELFERMASLEEEQTFSIKMSYLEIYNERVRDLLKESTNESVCSTSTILEPTYSHVIVL